MSFDLPNVSGQRIAIIGGGISGMAAAYMLQGAHSVTLFEAEKKLGGHARTVQAGRTGAQPVDTGFIVFNYVNYPHLTRMFRDLEVPVEKSDMSFGATIDGGRVEYGLRDLSSLLGQKRNLLRPGFARMVRDILRFNARAEEFAHSDDATIGDLMDQLQLGDWFRDYYLLPVCGAIWSTPTDEIRDFPARSMVQFFRNHALLSATGQHQWWTVSGGSIEYVRRLETNLRQRGAILRTGTPVQGISRLPGQVTVHLHNEPDQSFDQVIMACHSDVALRLLTLKTPTEKLALSNVAYQNNLMVLHRDEGQMPTRRACWSSWVYQAQSGVMRPQIGVTYWMNRLQNIPESDPLFVTLNPATKIRDAAIYDQKVFRHPVFDRAALRAQDMIGQIQGQNNTWFAGAWLRHGFHEDGFASAVRVARALQKQTVQ